MARAKSPSVTAAEAPAKAVVRVLVGTLVVGGQNVGPGGYAELDAAEAEDLRKLGTVAIESGRDIVVMSASAAPAAAQASLLPDAGDEAGDPTEA
jgi:hypothetical protein